MADAIRRTIGRLRLGAKRATNAIAGFFAVAVLKLLRLTNPDKMADLAGWVLRTIGPRLREHRIARANLAAAFPDKPDDEIERILRGAWDNLGRVGVEFAHLDRLWDYFAEHPDRPSRIAIDEASHERFARLRDDGKPALIFAAHLANWELPAVCAATNGLDSAVLYRGPNIAAIDRWLSQTRAANMGELIATSMNAPAKLTEALARGIHVGILVDQYYHRGVEVTFFGRRTMANPLLARLARHVDCPIHGVRIVRLPGHRFRAELSEAVEPARNAQGEIDVAGTMQRITDVVEGWIREHPEQWLWQHRRWR